jgi:uncharacterized membrane protein
MFKLENSLKEWVAKGFITENEAQQITVYESNKTEHSYALSTVLILGIIIIGIGIISLIAANWDTIPDAIKLAADFILLILCGFLILYTWKKQKELIFEMLLLFFMLLCLASIGLISQIYQTSGEFYDALLFWSLITAPIMLCAKSRVPPFIWMAGFLIGLDFTLINSPAANLMTYEQMITYIVMATPLLCFVLASLSLRFLGNNGSTLAFEIWIFITGLFAIIFKEIFYQAVIPNFIYAVPICSYLLIVFSMYFILTNQAWHKGQKSILLLLLAIFIILFHFDISSSFDNYGFVKSLIQAFFTIFLLAITAFFMASVRRPRWFQWFVFLIGVRFLFIYFEVIGSLAMTGIGLIISGILIVFMAVLWNKYRKPLAAWALRWTT